MIRKSLKLPKMTQKRVYRTIKQRNEINTVDNRPRSDGLRETRIKASFLH